MQQGGAECLQWNRRALPTLFDKQSVHQQKLTLVVKPEDEVVRGDVFRLEETLQVSENALHVADSKARLTDNLRQSQNHNLLSSSDRISREIAAIGTSFQILLTSNIHLRSLRIFPTLYSSYVGANNWDMT